MNSPSAPAQSGQTAEQAGALISHRRQDCENRKYGLAVNKAARAGCPKEVEFVEQFRSNGDIAVQASVSQSD